MRRLARAADALLEGESGNFPSVLPRGMSLHIVNRPAGLACRSYDQVWLCCAGSSLAHACEFKTAFRRIQHCGLERDRNTLPLDTAKRTGYTVDARTLPQLTSVVQFGHGNQKRFRRRFARKSCSRRKGDFHPLERHTRRACPHTLLALIEMCLLLRFLSHSPTMVHPKIAIRNVRSRIAAPALITNGRPKIIGELCSCGARRCAAKDSSLNSGCQRPLRSSGFSTSLIEFLTSASVANSPGFTGGCL